MRGIGGQRRGFGQLHGEEFCFGQPVRILFRFIELGEFGFGHAGPAQQFQQGNLVATGRWAFVVLKNQIPVNRAVFEWPVALAVADIHDFLHPLLVDRIKGDNIGTHHARQIIR